MTNGSNSPATLPTVVSMQQWQQEIASLREQEKAHTRAGDALSARRRQLPMVAVTKSYELQGEQGAVDLKDLFDGRRQLILYHFMFAPDDTKGCPGCSWVADALPHPAHLNARDTSLAMVSRAPLNKLLAYKEAMQWTLPWYSSFGSDFNYDFNATNADGENHVASVFLKDDDKVYWSYYTDNRGVEHLGSHWTYLDLTPFGRQEPWEDSPPGRPKGEFYWTRRHNEYDR